jgi:hypothetical protein
MAEKIKLTISPVVARYVRPGTPLETRLGGCTEAEQLEVSDRVMLLFCLSKDTETTVRSSALACLMELPSTVIREYLALPSPHPLVCAALPQVCRYFPKDDVTVEPPNETIAQDPLLTVNDAEAELLTEDASDEAPGDENIETPPDLPEEEYQSKYKMAQVMGIGEKIKMALTGDKEWRSILVKDANKLVSGSVIKNPRITEAEILTLVKSGIQNDEIMRLICANKEWVKNYQIRRALIENNRTPIQSSMRYLGTMGEKDLASFAKSKNIATALATMAKRLLLNKKK